jgi:hypothetical protein
LSRHLHLPSESFFCGFLYSLLPPFPLAATPSFVSFHSLRATMVTGNSRPTRGPYAHCSHRPFHPANCRLYDPNFLRPPPCLLHSGLIIANHLFFIDVRPRALNRPGRHTSAPSRTIRTTPGCIPNKWELRQFNPTFSLMNDSSSACNFQCLLGRVGVLEWSSLSCGSLLLFKPSSENPIWLNQILLG